MLSSERLFSILTYALFATPAAVVVIWVIWRAMVVCLFYAGLVSAWVGRLPTVVQIPTVSGLLLLAGPVLLLAFIAWVVVSLFPGLAPPAGAVPRLFARSRSHALSLIFLSFLILLFFVVPLRYLAYRIEGPQISFWHWVLVFGPVPVLIAWLVARIRRMQREEARERALDARIPP